MPTRKKQPAGGKAPVSPKKRTAKAARATADAPVSRKRTRAAAAAVNGGGKQDLVIVESPAKAKTINKYLGSNFKVLASYGHVRDLPPKGKVKGEEVVGVQIAAGWRPRYVVVDRGERGGKGRRSAQDILDELKREADRSNFVYLATDPDREGESIAWHISEALSLDPARTRRIAFNEITKTAVQNALAHPSSVNDQLVQAQEARRILDRVVGYPLSNLLGKKVTRGLSAGRVQSVAVRLIVEREREIEAFKSEEYWKITALLAPRGTVSYQADPAKAKVYAKQKGSGVRDQGSEVSEAGEGEAVKEAAPKVPAGAFLAELVRWQGQEFKANTEQQADAVYAALNTASYAVAKVEQKDRSEHAPPPFTTSTLQQQANIRLRMSARHSMGVAQELYQGVPLGSEGSVALITYMRTDSTRVSADALQAVRQHISAHYGPSYLPATPNTYKSGKSAQEAHEAIRPTDLNYTPQSVQPYLSHDQHRLYTLIYNRFVASQMAPAVFAVTNVEVLASREVSGGVVSVDLSPPTTHHSPLTTHHSPLTTHQGVFKAQGRIEKFDGYRRVLPPAGKQEDTTLPPLAEKQPLDKLDLTASQHFTQPPPRYNEASLVKTLEKEGIGRPSTYATIISTIQHRGYVRQEHRRFYATEIGKLVTDLLVRSFPKVMDVKFTSHIEEELDDIENGKIRYAEVLNEFWAPFSEALQKADTEMPRQKGVETGEPCPRCGKPLVEMYSKKTARKFVGCSGWKDGCKYIKPGEGESERPEPVATEIPCPTCGKPMLQRMGRRGPFLGCSGYPECKTVMNLDAEGKPVLAAKPTEHVCEKCGSKMVLREGRRGPFLACSGYPKCKNAKDVDAEGNPIQPIDTGIQCEKCGSAMTVKRGPRGPFLGCSAYPKCRSTKPMPPDLKEKLKDLLPAPKKPTTPAVEVHETCPECGAPMKLRNSRRGFFLGCSKYPKCKGTREAPPELLEQLQPSPA